MKYRAYIFDIDDTLYLERDEVRDRFRSVGAALGIPEFGVRCFEGFEQGLREDVFEVVKSEFPEITCDTNTLVELYRGHRPQIRLCEDAAEFLYGLRGRTGSISDGMVAVQRAKFRSLGLLPWIECPLFTGETCAPKPAPAAFQIVAWTLNIPYEKCVYFGDDPHKDFAGPKSLGMHTVRIRRPMSLCEKIDSGSDVDEEWDRFLGI